MTSYRHQPCVKPDRKRPVHQRRLAKATGRLLLRRAAGMRSAYVCVVRLGGLVICS